MLAKERASGACHMCQRSGCAAGAARRTAPSASAHILGGLFKHRPPAPRFWLPGFFLHWLFVLDVSVAQQLHTTKTNNQLSRKERQTYKRHCNDFDVCLPFYQMKSNSLPSTEKRNENSSFGPPVRKQRPTAAQLALGAPPGGARCRWKQPKPLHLSSSPSRTPVEFITLVYPLHRRFRRLASLTPAPRTTASRGPSSCSNTRLNLLWRTSGLLRTDRAHGCGLRHPPPPQPRALRAQQARARARAEPLQPLSSSSSALRDPHAPVCD